MGLIPGSVRSPGEGNGYPLQYSCLKNPMDREAWRATVQRVAESDMTEQASPPSRPCEDPRNPLLLAFPASDPWLMFCFWGTPKMTALAFPWILSRLDSSSTTGPRNPWKSPLN